MYNEVSHLSEMLADLLELGHGIELKVSVVNSIM